MFSFCELRNFSQLLLIMVIFGLQICPGYSDKIANQNENIDKNKLLTNPLDIKINVGDSVSFDVYLKNPPKEPVKVSIQCHNVNCSAIRFDEHFSHEITLTPDVYSHTINITGIRPGHDDVEFNILNNVTNEYIDTKLSFVRIGIGRGQFWKILGAIFGWGYFFIWSLSFWPQNFTNYRRKSVVGLSLDYTILHFTGFIYYSIFNISLYYSKTVQELYEEKIPRSEIPVEFNDVVYALHAAFTTSITFIQCFIYERGDQRLALYSKLFQTIVWSVGGILMILVFCHVVTWLTFIYYFSYVKLLVTSIKYLPQLWFNFRRKSTKGWTIYMVLLDVTGGSLSMLQMITNAYNYDDWLQLVGNLPKFGLGLASVFYDILFLLQHYVLYRNREPKNINNDNGNPKHRNNIHDKNNALYNMNSTSILVENNDCDGSDFTDNCKKSSIIMEKNLKKY